MILLYSSLLIISIFSFFSHISFHKVLFLSLLTFVLFVIYKYTLPSSSDLILGHILPYSDASGYFAGASKFYHGIVLDPWASRRPIYSVFLSGLLFIAGGSLDIAILLQLILNIGIIGYSSYYIFENFGKRTSIIFLFLIIIFYSRFSLTTMTEALGFQSSLLSLLFLIEFSKTKSTISGLIFFLLLSFGLNVRAGSFFMIPSIFLMCIYVIKNNFKRLQFGFFGLIAATLPFVITKVFSSVFSDSTIIPMSNFSYTLYGLVSGGKGWTYVLQVHPEVLKLNESLANQEIYRLAFNAFKENQLGLVKGIFIAFRDFFYPTGRGMFGFLEYQNHILSLPTRIFFMMLFLFALKSLWQSRSSDLNKTLGAAFIGIFLSVPFVFPMDSDMMRAQACAIPFISLITAIVFRSEPQYGKYSYINFLPALYGVILLISIINFSMLNGTSISHEIYTPASSVKIRSNDELEKVTRKLPVPEIVNKLKKLNVFLPYKLTMGYDFKSEKVIWLIYPRNKKYGLYHNDSCSLLQHNFSPDLFPVKGCHF